MAMRTGYADLPLHGGQGPALAIHPNGPAEPGDSRPHGR